MMGRYAKCANYHSPVRQIGPFVSFAAKLPHLGTFGAGGFCFVFVHAHRPQPRRQQETDDLCQEKVVDAKSWCKAHYPQDLRVYHAKKHVPSKRRLSPLTLGPDASIVLNATKRTKCRVNAYWCMFGYHSGSKLMPANLRGVAAWWCLNSALLATTSSAAKFFQHRNIQQPTKCIQGNALGAQPKEQRLIDDWWELWIGKQELNSLHQNAEVFVTKYNHNTSNA